MKDNGVPDWGRLAELAAAIMTCPRCEEWTSTKPPEPFWVGPDYRRGGIVLLAPNPADKGGRPLPPEAQQRLDRLRDSHAVEDFPRMGRLAAPRHALPPVRRQAPGTNGPRPSSRLPVGSFPQRACLAECVAGAYGR